MSFLYPGFLFALSAIAIPVIIHLFNFRKYKTVYFSNTRFLHEVKEKTDSRTQLRHLLVLLCRILAITFLVLAFAQPYFKSGKVAATTGKKAVSVFIDNSFSMAQLESGVPLIDRAKLKAREIVNAYGDNDDFQLLTQDFEGRHQRLVDKAEMVNLINEVQLSPNTRNISDVVARQEEALHNSPASDKELYVLSDFQKNFSDINSIRPDSLFHIGFVPLQAGQSPNVYIDTCWLQTPVQLIGQPVKLMVKIVNDADQVITSGRLTLKINGQVKAIGNYAVPANASALDTLVYNITDKGWNKAELSIIDHPINFDDNYFFSYEVAEHIDVTLINESAENPFLNVLFSGSDFFNVVNVPFNQLNYGDLSNRNFVVLNGLKEISSGLAQALTKFVSAGGNLLIFPDASSDLNSYNLFLSGLHADQLTGFSTAKKSVASLNTQDAVFSNVFEQAPQNLALPEASGSFTMTRMTATNASPLMLFGDGAPFITRYTFGNGLFYLSSVPLDKTVTDLPLHPLFAPMVYNMAVMKESSLQNAFVIGKDAETSVTVDFSQPDQVLHLKGASQELIPQQRLAGNRLIIHPGNEISQSGIYSLQDAGGDVKAFYAMNYDRKESDMHFMDDATLSKLSSPLKIKVIQNPGRDLAGVISGQNFGLPLWKVSVIFVLIFIALEILLLKFWK